MSVPGFSPRPDGFGGRKGERTSASFLTRMQDEVFAARNAAVSFPLTQESTPAGEHLGLDRETLDLLRFQLTADLASGGSATASPVIYNPETFRWDLIGEEMTVYDSFGKADGSTRLKSGDYGFAKWFGDNGLWEIVQAPGGSGGGGDDFFPARIDCRSYTGGCWIYGWTEMTWTDATVCTATVLTGGRTGSPARVATVTQTAVGDGSTAEVETISFIGPPIISGTWTITGTMSATPYTTSDLAFNASASDVQAALRALNSSAFPAVTVSGDMTSGFTIIWPSTGAQTPLTTTISNLLPNGPTWPACELNNQPVKIGVIVWMKRGYKLTTAVAVVTKTTPGNGIGTHAAYSMYVDGASGGTYTVSFDGVTSAAISYGATVATVKAAIEATTSGLTLSSLSGAGTLANPWTFTVTSNANDHTIIANGSSLKDGSGYRFGKPVIFCGHEDTPGYVAGAAMNVLTIDSSGCQFCVQTGVCP